MLIAFFIIRLYECLLCPQINRTNWHWCLAGLWHIFCIIIICDDRASIGLCWTPPQLRDTIELRACFWGILRSSSYISLFVNSSFVYPLNFKVNNISRRSTPLYNIDCITPNLMAVCWEWNGGEADGERYK